MKSKCFRCTSVLFSLLVWAIPLVAQPGPSVLDVQDTIALSTTWCADTVRVLDTTVIADGVTVTICPGTIVEFKGHYPIYVHGAIQALGTKAGTILFSHHPNVAGWSGLRFKSPGAANDSSIFTYCRFLDGWANGPAWDSSDCQGTGGAIFVKTWRKMRFTQCIFEHNKATWSGGAVKMLDSSRVLMDYCEFFSNQAGYINDNYSGGAIHMARKCELVLRGCYFHENYSPMTGGAIMLVDGSSLDVDSSTFEENRSDLNGGAIVGSLGSQGEWPVSIAIRNSEFMNNSAGFNGGAIFACTSEQEMTGTHRIEISNTSFNRNLAGEDIKSKIEDGHGGAVHVRQTLLSLEYCNFIQNIAGASSQCGHAGAVRGVWGSEIHINHCMFGLNEGNHGGAVRGDHRTVIVVDSSRFMNNIAYNSGGAIRGSDSCIVTVNECIFTGNTANYQHNKPPTSGGQGGAIFLCPGDGWPSRPSEAYIYHSDFTGNGAGSHAGAVKMGEDGILVMEHNRFSDNNSNHSAGALMWGEGATGHMTDCYVGYSTAEQDGGALVIGDGARASASFVTFVNNECGKDGGAVKVAQDAWARFEDCWFRLNEAGEKGGALKSSDGDSVFITRCVVDTNTSQRGGGGMMLGESNYGEVSQSQFIGNYSTEKGGGLALGKYFEGEVSQCQFLYNALDAADNCDGGSKGGGLFMGEYGELMVSECVVANNSTRDSIARGGGIFAGYDSEMTIRNSTITQNRAEGDSAHGGGVFMGEYAILHIDTTSLNFNSSGGHGGGLFCGYGAEVHLQLCFVGNNTATLHGGGIKLGAESNLTGSNLMIDENFAMLHGGGLHMCPSGELDLHDSRFRNNMSWKGGGMSLNTPYQVLVDHTMFESNTATSAYLTPDDYEANGGGVELSGHGWGKGSMIMPSSTPDLTFSNCTFKNNSAEWNGGGLFLGGSMPKYVNLIQNVITNNDADHAGGGLSAGNHILAIVNTTIANNYSDSVGGGLHYADFGNTDTSTIINTILYGNEANVDGDQVSLGDGSGGVMDSSAMLNFYYCDIEGDSSDFGGCVAFNGMYENNLDTLPGFLLPSAYYGPAPDAMSANWSLVYVSPLRNRGTLDTTGLQLLALDFFGRPRLNEDTVDMGAYETTEGINFPPLVPNEFCPLDAGVLLPAGQPAGGVHSGPGVAGGAFFPAFAGPGTHQLTYTITYPGGLSESASIFVTVHPFDAVSLSDLHVCTDQTSLVLTGGTPIGGLYTGPWISGGIFDVAGAGPGSYPVVYSYQNIYGCVSGDTAMLHVHPLPVVSVVPMPPVCEGQGPAQLSGGLPLGGTYSGQYVQQGVLNFPGPGQYPFLYTYADGVSGCHSTAQGQLSVLEDPVVDASGDGLLCLGSCVTMHATGAQNYVWSTGAQTSFLTMCPSQSTTYYVTGTASNGCPGADSVTITVLPAVIADIQPATPVICSGSSVTLTATGAGGMGKYFWSDGTTGSTNTVAPLQTTTYTVTASTLHGCTDAVSVTVDVLPLPTIQTGEPYEVCQGISIDLNASGGVAYAWSHGLAAVPNPVAAPLADITYTLTVTGSNGCTASEAVFVDVLDLPALNLGPDLELCMGTCATLTAPQGMAQYSWTMENLITGAMQTLSATAEQTLCPLFNSRAYLKVTDGNGCEALDNVLLTVNPVYVPDILADTIHLLLGDAQQIFVGTPNKGGAGSTYTWYPHTFLDDPGVREPVTSALYDITYSLTVTNIHGCTGTDEVVVVVDPYGNSVGGSLKYQNWRQEALGGVPVYLHSQDKTIIDTTYTDAGGFFAFTLLPDGAYCLSFDADQAFLFNGVNALDALLTAYHFANMQNLNGIFAEAADVNHAGGVNTTDAALIAMRFAGLLQTLPAGEWTFSNTCFSLSGGNMIFLPVQALFTGDVNGSAAFDTKDAYVPAILTRGEVQLSGGQRVNLPVTLAGLEVPGSASLVLGIPDNWTVRDVEVSTGLGGTLNWLQADRELRIAWYNPDPLRTFDAAASILVSIEGEVMNGQQLRVLAPSEITGLDGKRGGWLEIPQLVFAPGPDALFAFPNPSSALPSIWAEVPAEGKALLRLTDAVGRVVTEQLMMLEQGRQLLPLTEQKLTDGAYFLQVVSDTYQMNTRFVISR
ncbi:MAG TPA: hypothetical protein P5550_01520 [Bacteroidales bacterium]|nr:hypothetical protein [Bacteroidales bacterium]